MKTLNSPAFQKKYLGDLEETEENDASESGEDKTKTEGDLVTSGSDPLTEEKLKEHNAAGDPDPTTKDEENEKQSEIDMNNSDDTTHRGSSDDGSEDGVPPRELLNNSLDTRYEIRRWWLHVRMAEDLWPSESERESSEEWAALRIEMVKFVENEKVFRAWGRAFLGLSMWTWAPLHVAANFGLCSLVSRLLENGADISSTNDEGQTALHIAAHGKWPRMLRLLLDNGADPNYVGEKSDMTPFHYWLLFQPPVDDIKLFLERGASSTKLSKSTRLR